MGTFDGAQDNFGKVKNLIVTNFTGSGLGVKSFVGSGATIGTSTVTTETVTTANITTLILTGTLKSPYIITGSGSPVALGVGSGYPKGSLYINTSLVTATTTGLYIKVAQTGSGWRGVTSSVSK